MDKLTKDQKDEYATSFAALALYDGGVSYFKSCALNVHKNWCGVCVAFQEAECSYACKLLLVCSLQRNA